MGRTRIATQEGVAAVRAVALAHRGGNPVDRRTERLATRYTLQLLAERAPGSAVEVRVPPFAAVQAVAGPVHRRGTPSAVVETDARTWLDLATGATTWESAVRTGAIRASGERADLGPWLPLLRA